MIFKSDTTEIQSFLEDTSSIRDGYTDGVFFAESYEEVCTILRECNEKGTRVTLSGNGTGTTGGRIPFGGVVLSMQRLNHILNISKLSDGSGVASVQCSVLLFDLQSEVEYQGLLYPPDPTERYCFIGGTIANNSSGARTFKYGATRKYVERLKVALANGEMVDIHRGEYRANNDGVLSFSSTNGTTYRFSIPTYSMPNVSKHIAGYFAEPKMDLIDLFIGSEGTLGVILEADLKLLKKPEQIISGLLYFEEEPHLLGFVSEARAITKAAVLQNISARAIEYFDVHSLNFLRKKYPQIPKRAIGAIFFEQEITKESEEVLLEKWFKLIEKHHALIDESWIALTPEEQQSIRDFRHALPVLVNEWYQSFGQRKISTDMAVPDDEFPMLMNAYTSGCKQNQLEYILFGHIGDAHLHLNILPKNAEEAERAKALYRGFIKQAIAMGGTISAEHGVGKLKSEYLVEMFGERGIKEMVSIKKALDPNLILNIGNLIPMSYLNQST